MGYFLDACPPHNFCCCNIPLRIGVFVIAVLGLIWSAVWIFGYTEEGIKVFPENSIPEVIKKGIQYLHGVFGVYLATDHLFLFVGAIAQSKILLELYIWLMIIIWVFIGLSVVLMGMIFGKQEVFLHVMMVYGPIVLIPLFLWIYFMVIVGNYRLTIP